MYLFDDPVPRAQSASDLARSSLDKRFPNRVPQVRIRPGALINEQVRGYIASDGKASISASLHIFLRTSAGSRGRCPHALGHGVEAVAP
jgi:hypothetical protein